MFRWIERARTLELELESDSEEGVFIDALEALRELLEEDTGAGLDGAADYEVTASGSDRGALLADWLRRLAALAEDDGFVPARITSIDFTDDGLTACVEGACGDAAHLVGGIDEDALLYERAPDSDRVHARVVVRTQAPA